MQIVILLVYVVAIGAMMYFLAIKPQKKQQRESKELLQELAASENALKQARGELSGLMTELEISKKTVEKEKTSLQNVRISFEKYRKEEEQEKARLRRQRNTVWLLAAAALAYGIKG